MKKLELNDDQVKRYSRHILLPEVGGKGQRKLLEGRVLVIGTGGLGAPVSFYLAAAGVGTIGLVDGDTVEVSNLQRQIIHFTHDIGKHKTDSAREKMEALNPDIKVAV
ncbi:MAG: ThiF family adenylyltransferase, partial [Nitrospirae bacterium]|nr:ThiF family adenylyltransferase [Nitrospirota bacterium]